MCSSPAQRIAEIGQAIDDLAAQALAVYAPSARRLAEPTQGAPDSAGARLPGDITNADQVVIRLAALWALLAELDPEVARRLPTYEA